MESCLKFHFLKQGFEWFKFGRKWKLNLIQTKTRAKTSIDADFRHCEMIICTKFMS